MLNLVLGEETAKFSKEVGILKKEEKVVCIENGI
jgi:hypothetical protein